MDILQMLCIADINDDDVDDVDFNEYEWVYCTLSSISVVVGSNGYITAINDLSGTTNNYIRSANGMAIKISSLNCKTYPEFLVALDINYLWHGPAVQIDGIGSKSSSNISSAMLKRLQNENAVLKKKLLAIKKLFNDVRQKMPKPLCSVHIKW